MSHDHHIDQHWKLNQLKRNRNLNMSIKQFLAFLLQTNHPKHHFLLQNYKQNESHSAFRNT